MEHNLPEDHWKVSAANAIFLLNRFPNLSGDSTAPIDGDQTLPMEMLTRGRYSRRQLYRELSYFVQVGTPALVHVPSVKGSTLAPKVRWGIAWGMYREQVIWRDPFTHSQFRSKSFTAFELRDNLNYAQFLGLREMETTRKGVAILGDYSDVVTVWLKPALPASPAQRQPVVKIQNASGDAVQYIDLPAQEEQQDPYSGPFQSEGGEEADELTEITRTCPELGGSDHETGLDYDYGWDLDSEPDTGQQLNTDLDPGTDLIAQHKARQQKLN